MSVISQGPCPYCSSSDAYTLYDDGGTYCYSCHDPRAYSKGNSYHNLTDIVAGLSLDRQTKINLRAKEINPTPPLPEDSHPLVHPYGRGYSIEYAKAYQWVLSYGITDAEIDKHGFLFSDEKKLLIFPAVDKHLGLLMWQGRYFGDNKRHPKYLTRGLKDSVVHIIGADKPGPLVLVEDLISAIKVGRVAPAMPLWGSYLSKEMAQRLSIMWNEVYLWLDYDKREEATKQSIQHCMRLDIKPIITSLDPKCYTEEEIENTLEDLHELSKGNYK